jgi:hypothetical protein
MLQQAFFSSEVIEGIIQRQAAGIELLRVDGLAQRWKRCATQNHSQQKPFNL